VPKISQQISKSLSEVYKSRAMTDITQTTVANHNPPDSSPA
jgi:hypothetical protein